mgnify:CR=1 FL=1
MVLYAENSTNIEVAGFVNLTIFEIYVAVLGSSPVTFVLFIKLLLPKSPLLNLFVDRTVEIRSQSIIGETFSLSEVITTSNTIDFPAGIISFKLASSFNVDAITRGVSKLF